MKRRFTIRLRSHSVAMMAQLEDEPSGRRGSGIRAKAAAGRASRRALQTFRAAAHRRRHSNATASRRSSAARSSTSLAAMASCRAASTAPASSTSYRPASPSAYESSGSSTYLDVFLEGTLVRDAARAMGLDPDLRTIQPQLGVRDLRAEHILWAIKAELESDEHGGRAYVMAWDWRLPHTSYVTAGRGPHCRSALDFRSGACDGLPTTSRTTSHPIFRSPNSRPSPESAPRTSSCSSSSQSAFPSTGTSSIDASIVRSRCSESERFR
jgi:hypothetical protein